MLSVGYLEFRFFRHFFCHIAALSLSLPCDKLPFLYHIPRIIYTLSIVCLTRVWQPIFHFSVTKRSSFPFKLGKALWSTTTCMYKLTFCLNSAKCWFCSLGPIAKFAHCQQYDLAWLYCLQLLAMDKFYKGVAIRLYQKRRCFGMHSPEVLWWVLWTLESADSRSQIHPQSREAEVLCHPGSDVDDLSSPGDGGDQITGRGWCPQAGPLSPRM